MLGKRVLVIEDDKDSLHAISELLRQAEYEVLTAESGREGLRHLHGATPPDFVVLDFSLPDMTGHALLSLRTRWPGALHVPVLLLTGDDDWVDDTAAHKELTGLGVTGLLRKPVDADELLNTLRAARRSQPPTAGGVVLQNDDDTALAAGIARQTRRLSDLLTRVSELLAQGLDVGAQLREVARALVPGHATACVIERVDTASSVRELLCTQHEASALDSDLRSWALQPDWLAPLLTEVADSGKPRVLDLENEPHLLGSGSQADVASARALGFESVLVVPMVARGRLFGMLTCAARAKRRYGRTHVEAFAELGHRIALALDHAELYASAQRLRRDHDALCQALTSELRAPLTMLTDVANKALEHAETTRERSLAETIMRETRSLEARLQALKDFAGCAAGQLQLDTREIDLTELVRARFADQETSVSVELDPALSGLHVQADPERLAQVLSVLLQVATANTPQRGKVEVGIKRPSGEEPELHLTVSYTGPCLSPQLLADLGQPSAYDYEALASVSDSQPGFGLRLARALVEAQTGRFWAQTQQGVGNSFHIALPLCSVPIRDTTDEPPPNAVILLVDSDLAFRRELQEILSERGYHVETADNGLQAWQYLLGHPPPALILFDLVLPAMDGWELHTAIKSHAALQLVPTVVVSGLDRYRIEASLPDAHGYIEKPIRSAQLFEVVQRHVVSPARPRTLSIRPSSFF